MMEIYDSQLLQTSRTHSRGAVNVADSLWSQLTGILPSLTRGLVSRLAKDNVLRALSNITEGEIEVVTQEESFTFGAPSAVDEALSVKLVVKNDAFWTRIALFTDLGLAESYMCGDVDCEDISCLIRIIIANRQKLDHLNSFASSLLLIGRRLTAYKFLGDLATSPANISAHYDLGNALFEAFLSEDMNYSSAIFRDFGEDLGPVRAQPPESLESAQLRKMRLILRQLKIQPGDRVLEFGTGWGALAILAAETVDCTMDTITLSTEQAELSAQLVAEKGLSDRVRVHYMDFRECRDKPEWQGAFDKFFSIEMVDHVDKQFIPEFWSVVDWALKPRTGVGVVQVISMPEARIPAYDKSGLDFIQKWIFPGCYIPSLCYMIDTMTEGSEGRLTTDSVTNIGPHYARTLREWKRKFLANWKDIAKELMDRYNLDARGLEIFKRKWIYYFDYCEAGFRARSLGDHVITFTREANPQFGCDFNPDF